MADATISNFERRDSFLENSAILFATIAIEAKLVLDKKRRKVATFHVVTFWH